MNTIYPKLLLFGALHCFAEIPTITLNNGVKIPVVGLGTFRVEQSEATRTVKDAIDAGYRHIDTAHGYGNEKDLGQGIEEKVSQGVVKREDLFVTTKLIETLHEPENVEKGLRMSLQRLGLKYVDLYLIHTPMGYLEGYSAPSDVDYVDTWLAMEKVYEKGLARAIGISNFNKKQIERLLERSTVVPAVNQVESHPYLNQQKLIDFCKSKNITITAHSPLGQARLLEDKPDVPILIQHPQVTKIANKVQKTPVQVLIRYQVQRGVVVIPKTVHKNRMAENLNIFDFELSASDMAVLNGLDIHGRFSIFGVGHKYYPFDDEY